MDNRPRARHWLRGRVHLPHGPVCAGEGHRRLAQTYGGRSLAVWLLEGVLEPRHKGRGCFSFCNEEPMVDGVLLYVLHCISV